MIVRRQHRVLVQGITGKQGTFWTEAMQAYFDRLSDDGVLAILRARCEAVNATALARNASSAVKRCLLESGSAATASTRRRSGVGR